MFDNQLENSAKILKNVSHLLTLITFLILVAAAQTKVSAATFVVTNTADSGAGSLRQAVADANATPIADTINFNIPLSDPNCTSDGVCTITLASVLTLQSLGSSLSIVNQTGASKLIISGNNSTRIIEGFQSGDLTLDGLTITRGVSGSSPLSRGTINNYQGHLTIRNCVITQNPAAYTINSTSTITNSITNIINTTISNNGGLGVFATNEITMGGTLNITNSTINNNAGTGAHLIGSKLTIVNSTISNNQSGLVVTKSSSENTGGPYNIINSTITANANEGIVTNYVQLYVLNSIVSGNGGSPNILVFFGSIISLGNTIYGSYQVPFTGSALWGTTDIPLANPQLAPLADNGGMTKTHALLPNSPAINGGYNCVLTANACGNNNPALPTDQRGVARVGNVDIGSYEYAAPRKTPFDFDGDGRADIGVVRPASYVWYQLLGSNYNFNWTAYGTANDVLTPADYDGDGKTDLSIFRPSTGQWVYGNQQFVTTWGQNGDIPLPSDVDGDGKADFVVFRPSDRTWYRITNGTGNYTFVPFGAVGDQPVIGDFDGDGKSDPAVFRPSSGEWFYASSSQGGVHLRAALWGLAGDKLVPADYDGDGKTDAAIYRNGLWAIYNSSNGSNTILTFGQAGDKPVAADYDGDGKADVAVYRPSDGYWYILRSTSGFQALNFGANTDLPLQNAFVQ